jgi:hypothetical protein
VTLFLAIFLAVAAAAPAQAAVEVPLTPEGEPICVGCHAAVSPDIVRTWRSQQHGLAKVGCNECHNSHEQQFTPAPLVAVCQGCHDVKRIHGEFDSNTPAEKCMECHTGHVHLLAGAESWFQGGLPPEKLAGETEDEGVSKGAAAAAGVVVVVGATLFGLLVGWVLNRFVREL